MAKIKYLGTADIAVLERGEDFGGRLGEPLTKRVEFNYNTNRHVVDSDEVGLSDEAVALLVEDTDRFKDVTDVSRVPTSLHEQMFRGLPKSQGAEVALSQEPSKTAPSGSQDAPQDAPVASGGQSVEGTAPSTPARSTSGGGRAR